MGKSPFAQRDAEIARLRTELAAEKERPYLTEFANKMLHNLGVLLALTPYAKWPKEAKAAFEHTARDAPTMARIYKEQLPAE